MEGSRRYTDAYTAVDQALSALGAVFVLWSRRAEGLAFRGRDTVFRGPVVMKHIL